jgi:hypothetical protein
MSIEPRERGLFASRRPAHLPFASDDDTDDTSRPGVPHCRPRFLAGGIEG